MSCRAWESCIIEQPIEKVWPHLRSMDFTFSPRVQSVRMGPDRQPPTTPWLVGEVGVVVYADSTKQELRVTERSDANYTIAWEVVSSEPSVSYSSAAHCVRLRRVTDSNSTFCEWTVDFSRDAGADVVADAGFKARDAFVALRAEAAKTWTFYSTSEEVTKGYNLTGKNFVVTGGNSGIGYETVRVLALRGANVIFTARDEKKCSETVAELKKGQPNAKVEGMVCALDSLKSIRAFGAAFAAKALPLHCLINNAGVMACPYGLTEDKFETQFGVNHIGHFELTRQLLPALRTAAAAPQSAGARIVVLSSGAHRRGDVNWADPNWTKPGSYDAWVAYGSSKTANILFAKHLHALLQKEGVKISVNAVHPGVIHTNLMRHNPNMFPKKTDEKDAKAPAPAPAHNSPLTAPGVLFMPRIKNVLQGAATTLVAALHPEYATQGGLYMSDCNPILPLPHARDMANAAKLWDMTEKLIAAALPAK